MIKKMMIIVGIGILLMMVVTFSDCIGGQKPNNENTTTPTPIQTNSIPVVYSFNDTSSGQTYTVHVNDKIQLSLTENPTTGYSWNLTLTDGLTMKGDEYIPSDTSGKLVGTGGIHTWNISAVKNGTQKITGIYKRPWEPVTGNETTFKLTINVGEGTCSEQTCSVIPPTQRPSL